MSLQDLNKDDAHLYRLDPAGGEVEGDWKITPVVIWEDGTTDEWKVSNGTRDFTTCGDREGAEWLVARLTAPASDNGEVKHG